MSPKDVTKRKVCLLGDGAVGKTSLVQRFVFDKFSDSYIASMGAKVSRKVVTIPGKDAEVVMLIWDVLGQQEFRRIHQSAIRDAAGAILVCDLTRAETLRSLDKWLDILHEFAGQVPIVIAGNKADLVDEIAMDPAALDQFAQVNHGSFRLTSAKTGERVEDIFSIMGRYLLDPTWKPAGPMHTESASFDINSNEDQMTVCIMVIQDEIGKMFGPLSKFIIMKQLQKLGYSKHDLPPNKIPRFVDMVLEVSVFAVKARTQMRRKLLALAKQCLDPGDVGSRRISIPPLIDAEDRIVALFTEAVGDDERSLPMVRDLFEEIDVDFRNPTRDDLLTVSKGLIRIILKIKGQRDSMALQIKYDGVIEDLDAPVKK
jgi:small GTP-binding protein